MTKIVAIMSGLIRDLAEFKIILAEIISLRSRGLIDEIIISSWHGEFDKLTDSKNFFNRWNISLMETEMPLGGWGNVARQKKSIYEATIIQDDDTWVFRLRTDKISNYISHPDVARRLHEIRLGGVDRHNRTKDKEIFTCDVYIWSASLIRFFHINDMLFLAKKPDVIKLATLDAAFDNKYSYTQITTEQRWFAGSFRHIPVFDGYFSYFHPNIVSSYMERQFSSDDIIIPKFIVRIFACYLLSLTSHFKFIRIDEFEQLSDNNLRNSSPAEYWEH